MSVLVCGMKMPSNCGECQLMEDGWCYAYQGDKQEKIMFDRRPSWCPLIEVPPHGDLIDKETLYNKTAEWEAQAMARLDELNRIPFDEMEREEYIGWRVWSAIYQERSAFKYDVFDAPVVLKGEEDATD